MELLKQFFQKRWLINILLIAGGLLIGWLVFGGGEPTNGKEQQHAHGEKGGEESTTWTCSMHPQIKQDEKGQCPICGMDLIPMEEAGNESELSVKDLQMSESAMKIARVQTSEVNQRVPVKEVRLDGMVKPDERRLAEITARFPGRIEELSINYKGQRVKKGEALATIYSPALVTAQKELLEAASMKDQNPQLYRSARSKLQQWDLTEEQINAIEEQDEPKKNFSILSPISGTVTKRKVTQGDYVKEGASLFKVIDLSTLWVLFDAYESDLPWVQEGDSIEFTVQSMPGQTFHSRVTFIDPFVDSQERVATVRTQVDNPARRLKPNMFARGVLKSRLRGKEEAMMVPKTAVLWTGKRSIVYVKNEKFEQPTFTYREIVLGGETGDHYIVQEGLKPEEKIVTNGVFKIDAAAQLQGKKSMMNQVVETKEEEDKNVVKTDYRDASPAKFQEQIGEVVHPYLSLKDHLVASDGAKAQSAADELQSALGNVDMKLLEGDAHDDWMGLHKRIESKTKTIAKSSDLEQQREAFIKLSQAMINAIDAYGVKGQQLYRQHCPMANDDKGADWISSEEQIRNPYYGDQMLTCGEVTDTLL